MSNSLDVQVINLCALSRSISEIDSLIREQLKDRHQKFDSPTFLARVGVLYDYRAQRVDCIKRIDAGVDNLFTGGHPWRRISLLPTDWLSMIFVATEIDAPITFLRPNIEKGSHFHVLSVGELLEKALELGYGYRDVSVVDRQTYLSRFNLIWQELSNLLLHRFNAR
jgi:hypothetical protein